MFNRRASLVVGICVGLALGSAAVAAPAPKPAPAPAPAKISDIGCVTRLVWFVNAGRDMAKDPARPEDKRISMYQTVELLRGALGYYEGRVDAVPATDRSKDYFAEYQLFGAMPAEQRTSEVGSCLQAFQAAENRVLSSMKSEK